MSFFSGPGGSTSVGPTSGGKIYAFNAIGTTVHVLVAPANTARHKITFHNPGTQDIFIIPAMVQTTGSNVANTVTLSLLGGAIRVYANGGEKSLEGECQGAWYAIAAAGSTNSLTVIDTNT